MNPSAAGIPTLPVPVDPPVDARLLPPHDGYVPTAAPLTPFPSDVPPRGALGSCHQTAPHGYGRASCLTFPTAPSPSCSPTSKAQPASGKRIPLRWPRPWPAMTRCCGRRSRSAAAACSRRWGMQCTLPSRPHRPPLMPPSRPSGLCWLRRGLRWGPCGCGWPPAHGAGLAPRRRLPWPDAQPAGPAARHGARGPSGALPANG